MAGKHDTKGLLVSLEKGELGVETAHLKTGDTIEIDGLPELKKVFAQLAEKMVLKGRISEQNGMLHFWGRSKNGEETEFSHNAYQPGMPFELMMTTSKTVSAGIRYGKEVVLSTLEPAFRQDILRALERAGKKPDEKLTAISEKVTVRTLARLEWFPGMFEDSGTLYRVTRLIRKDIGWEVWFEDFSEEQLPALQKQQSVSTSGSREVPVIQFADGELMPSRREADLDHLFSGFSEQEPVKAEHCSPDPQPVVASDVKETENTTSDIEPLQQEVLTGTELQTKLEQQPEPESEPEYIDVQAMHSEQSGVEQHNKLAEIKRISPEMYIQQLIDRLDCYTVQPMVLSTSPDVELGASVIGMQDIPQLTQHSVKETQVEVVEVTSSHMNLPHDKEQSIYVEPRWDSQIKHTSDNVVDNILADVDEWTRSSHKLPVKKPDTATTKRKSITHFFRR